MKHHLSSRQSGKKTALEKQRPLQIFSVQRETRGQCTVAGAATKLWSDRAELQRRGKRILLLY